MIGVEFFGH